MSSDVIIKNHEGQDITYPGVSGIVLRTANGSALYLNVNDQPDWAQTDKTAMNYIKNKPFYDNSLSSQCSFETLPEINFNALGYTFWQIADFTLEYSQIFSTVFDITYGSRTYSFTPIESEIILNDKKILSFQSAEFGYGFAICYTTGAFDVTVNETNVPVDVPATGIYFIYSQDITPSTEYLFKITYNDLKTLDKKFLPADLEFSQKQADWDQTDQSEKDFIKNKPFGEYEGQTDILPLTRCENFTIDPTFGLYAHHIANINHDFIVGETYCVLWDGQEYACEALDVSALYGGNPIVAFGNGAGFGYPSNNEPFIVVYNRLNGYLSLACLTHSELHEYHDVCIYQKNIFVKKIDQKYLPNMVSSWNDLSDKPFYEYEDQIEILPLTRYEDFQLDSDYDLYSFSTLKTYNFVAGETYTIRWDETEHTCVAQDASNLTEGLIGLGNCAIFGLEGNDEPFIIASIDGVGTAFFALTDKEEGGSHDVYITQKKIFAKPLDKKFIPIPFFGKENGVILDGTFQDTKYDSDGDGVADTWDGLAAIKDSSDFTLVVGETYTVMWNGVEYRCECMEAMGLPAIGNTIVLGEEDNGIPFAIGRDINGSVMGVVGWFAIPIELEDDGTYHCTISGNYIKKVDLQYLYQPDWNENNRNSGSYIANKPFGEITAGTIIVPEQNVNLTMDIAGNGALWASMVPNMGLSDYIVEGKSYNINFDGKYYTGVGVTQDSTGIGVMYQSDSTRIAIADNFQGTGLSLIISSQSGQHTVSVTCVEDIITKIDPKYLPDDIGGSSLPEVTTDDAGKFLRVSVDGTWVAESIPNAEGASF